MDALRVPITTASRMGVSKLAAKSAEAQVVLTSHGRPVAVIGAAEHLDEEIRLMREAAATVLDAAADIVSAKGDLLTLDETCERLGLDAGKIRARSAENRNR